jgi:CRISPR-associated endonuclease/helicase Cas3
MKQIKTLPVYSQIAQPIDLPEIIRNRLPDKWQLSVHQLATYQAIQSGEYDVVFNTSMTGDGKSLAAYLPTLLHTIPLLAMYPTNELARDQELQLPTAKEQWGGRFRHERITAARLEEKIAADRLQRKSQAIEFLTDNNQVILTNPDIFHYLAQFFYTRRNDAPDWLFGRKIAGNFDRLLFDEFHIFSTPQVVSVVNALLMLREISGHQPKRFLFLSATPNELLLDYLAKAEFRVQQVNGHYQHTFTPPDSTQWRRIIHATDIAFSRQSIEEWVEDNWQNVVLAFFKENQPAAKGAIIVNSVATAYRLAAKLKPLMNTEGFTVALNTGLTSDDLKAVSLESDLLIATSTVDVGVDFRINFLVFESRDAGTFLQRLGRLGRHNNDGRGHTFTTYQAHALVPPFILERLFPEKLASDGEYNREELATAIREVYPTHNMFARYAQEYGRIQCAHIYRSLAHPTIRDTYAQTRQKLKSLYWQIFKININRAIGDYKEWSATHKPLIEEAQSFRGGSPLHCGIIDETEGTSGKLKRYSLTTLAANANLTWLGKEAFTKAAQALTNGAVPFDVDELAGWFSFHGFANERHPISFILNHRLFDWPADKFGAPQILTKIRLNVDGVDWINELNRYLERRQFVVTLCLAHPLDLQRRLYLPSMFELYSFQSPLDGSSGAIAFARNALLLSIALQNSRFDCGGGSAIIT